MKPIHYTKYRSIRIGHWTEPHPFLRPAYKISAFGVGNLSPWQKSIYISYIFFTQSRIKILKHNSAWGKNTGSPHLTNVLS